MASRPPTLIRQRDRSRHTPILFLTAADTTQTQAVRGYAVGAVDYLVKPVVPEFVRSKVAVFVELAKKNELLRRQAALLAESEQAALELAETRAELVRELEHKNRELESFSYAVSHDLRAPLRRIDSFSRAILESQGRRLDDEGRKFLSRVREASQQMAQLIDDVLYLSRVTRTDLRDQDVDLSEVAELVVSRLQEAQPNRRVEVKIRPGVVVTGDGQLLKIAMENLLQNAWKFTGKQAEPRIEFGVTQSLRRADLLHPRQRGRLRHDVRRPAVRPLSAAAFPAGVSRERHRARHGSTHHPPPWREGMGRRSGGAGSDVLLHPGPGSLVTWFGPGRRTSTPAVVRAVP